MILLTESFEDSFKDSFKIILRILLKILARILEDQTRKNFFGGTSRSPRNICFLGFAKSQKNFFFGQLDRLRAGSAWLLGDRVARFRYGLNRRGSHAGLA